MINTILLLGSLQIMYLSEKIEYIFLHGKPLPEYTKYKCIDGRIYKYKYGYVRNHKGKHVSCETKTLTRKTYEDIINNY